MPSRTPPIGCGHVTGNIVNMVALGNSPSCKTEACTVFGVRILDANGGDGRAGFARRMPDFAGRAF